MKHTVLKYGIFIILIMMSIGLLIILNNLEIRTKQSVNIIQIRSDTFRIYIQRAQSYEVKKGDTVNVEQTISGRVSFIVERVAKEPSYFDIMVLSNKKNSRKQLFGGNTFSSGYIFTGKIKLWQLVIQKIQ